MNIGNWRRLGAQLTLGLGAVALLYGLRDSVPRERTLVFIVPEALLPVEHLDVSIQRDDDAEPRMGFRLNEIAKDSARISKRVSLPNGKYTIVVALARLSPTTANLGKNAQNETTVERRVTLEDGETFIRLNTMDQ